MVLAIQKENTRHIVSIGMIELISSGLVYIVNLFISSMIISYLFFCYLSDGYFEY